MSSIAPPSNDEQAMYREWFISVDEDRTGRINPKELAQALRAGGENFSPHTIDLMMKLFGRGGYIYFDGMS
jgi:Ca2+-binding EF-hand superfamily protein